MALLYWIIVLEISIKVMQCLLYFLIDGRTYMITTLWACINFTQKLPSQLCYLHTLTRSINMVIILKIVCLLFSGFPNTMFRETVSVSVIWWLGGGGMRKASKILEHFDSALLDPWLSNRGETFPCSASPDDGNIQVPKGRVWEKIRCL